MHILTRKTLKEDTKSKTNVVWKKTHFPDDRKFKLNSHDDKYPHIKIDTMITIMYKYKNVKWQKEK